MICRTCRRVVAVMIRKGSAYCSQHCDPRYTS